MTWTIVLSAGHGGRDPGASYYGVQEKVVNLAVTLACRDYLNNNFAGHRLVLPRDSDVFVSLPARRDLTAQVGADLYVSIHHNAYSIDTANGFSTHLSTGPLYGETRAYRNTIHDTVYSYVRTLGIRDRGKKFTDHDVTRMMPCPTVLMEYMFLSNRREAEIANTASVQKMLGRYTAIGIAKALGLPEKRQGQDPAPDIYWVVASKHSDYDAGIDAINTLRRVSPSSEPFLAYEREGPTPIYMVVAREFGRIDHATALKDFLRDRGFSADIIPADPGSIVDGRPPEPEPAPPEPDKPEPEPPRKKPEVVRPIGVMIGERRTKHEAWLLSGLQGDSSVGTLGRIEPILQDLGIRVTGHGDYIKIHLPDSLQTKGD